MTLNKCLECRKQTKELDSVWDRIRLWFFNRFHKDIIDLSQDRYTQGFGDGYKNGVQMTKEREREYINALITENQMLRKEKSIDFTPLDINSVLHINKNVVYLGGKELTQSQKEQLHAEAGIFMQSSLWKVLQESLKEHAYQVMFEKSQTFDDMRTGKTMLYNLSIMRKMIDLLQNMKKPQT